MRRAFVMTVYNRLDYLAPVLDSLIRVRGWADWDLYFSIEPSEQQDKILHAIYSAAGILAEHKINPVIWINPQKHGVLHHPWVVFDRLFSEGYEYVLRSEDDLIHGRDVLEYHKWASAEYRLDPEIGMVTSFSKEQDALNGVRRVLGLPNPLLIGTWRDRWIDLIRDTWDHDYSTHNGQPGIQAGWDWNLNTRVFPKHELCTLTPTHPHVDHIGVWGAHSTPEIFYQAPPFNPEIPQLDYTEV